MDGAHLVGYRTDAADAGGEVRGFGAPAAPEEGGKIQRQPGSKEPNGVLEEMAMLFVVKKLPAPTPEKAMAMLEQGLR
jgi:hypothetical protein